MNILSIIFIALALLNIIFSIIKWITEKNTQWSAITGWTCAIIYCVSANL